MQATLTSSNDSASSCTENAVDTTPGTSRAQASSSVRGAAGASEVAKLEQQSSSAMPAASWQASAGVAMSLDCVCKPAACFTSGEQALVARDLPPRAGDGGRGDQHARAEHWPTHQLMEVRGDSQSTLDHSLATSADRCQKRRARRVEWGAFVHTHDLREHLCCIELTTDTQLVASTQVEEEGTTGLRITVNRPGLFCLGREVFAFSVDTIHRSPLLHVLRRAVSDASRLMTRESIDSTREGSLKFENTALTAAMDAMQKVRNGYTRVLFLSICSHVHFYSICKWANCCSQLVNPQAPQRLSFDRSGSIAFRRPEESVRPHPMQGERGMRSSHSCSVLDELSSRQRSPRLRASSIRNQAVPDGKSSSTGNASGSTITASRDANISEAPSMRKDLPSSPLQNTASPHPTSLPPAGLSAPQSESVSSNLSTPAQLMPASTTPTQPLAAAAKPDALSNAPTDTAAQEPRGSIYSTSPFNSVAHLPVLPVASSVRDGQSDEYQSDRIERFRVSMRALRRSS